MSLAPLHTIFCLYCRSDLPVLEYVGFAHSLTTALDVLNSAAAMHFGKSKGVCIATAACSSPLISGGRASIRQGRWLEFKCICQMTGFQNRRFLSNCHDQAFSRNCRDTWLKVCTQIFLP